VDLDSNKSAESHSADIVRIIWYPKQIERWTNIDTSDVFPSGTASGSFQIEVQQRGLLAVSLNIRSHRRFFYTAASAPHAIAIHAVVCGLQRTRAHCGQAHTEACNNESLGRAVAHVSISETERTVAFFSQEHGSTERVDGDDIADSAMLPVAIRTRRLHHAGALFVRVKRASVRHPTYRRRTCCEPHACSMVTREKRKTPCAASPLHTA
jgi:hypothetical protein